MKNKLFYLLFLLFSKLKNMSTKSLEIQVKGTVFSSGDGLTIPGANVNITGTDISAMTDFDGNFTLENVPAQATLTVSFMGFTKQTFAVNGNKL